MNLDVYWRYVQQKICSKCVDGDGIGNCRLSEREECALKTHFPQIIHTVLSVKSDTITPYITALRENICTVCIHQSKDGKCQVRASVDCGLDRYYPLVVAAIEEVKAEAA
ncbi:MAG: hypothetical protein EPO24_13285 [Bacteroidetes bacterium]|nr:MAG: hypothetical protein EPO24_13285 [Bacteroidota bacterium]